MLDLMTHLTRLRTVADVGSMRRAAGILNVTQPALTRSIAQLESHFGKHVLVRHSRGVALTGFGERVVSSVQRLQRHWELEERSLEDDKAVLSGTLRVRAGPLWRAVILPPVVAELHRNHPDIVVEIQNNGSGPNDPMIDLVEGRCDLVFGGVQSVEETSQRLTVRNYTTIVDRVVAREDHPIFGGLQKEKNLDAGALLNYPWLVYTADPVYELQTIHACVERLGSAPRIRARCESLIATIAMLQKGDYLCILPDRAVANTVNPRIVPVPVDFGRRTIVTGAIFRNEMVEWPPLNGLLRICEKHIGGEGDFFP